MTTDFVEETPPRMHIVHMKSQDSVTAQYNPTEVSEKLGVIWQRLKVMGQSFQEMQYVQTKNLRVSFTMQFDEKSAHGVRAPQFQGMPAQLASQLPSVTRTSDAAVTTHPSENVTITSRRGITSQPGRTRVARQFLLACCFPVRGAQEVRDGAPSRLLFVWPEMWSIACRLVDVDIGHTTFGRKMLSAKFSATLKLEVDAIGERLDYETILEYGYRLHGAGDPG